MGREGICMVPIYMPRQTKFGRTSSLSSSIVYRDLSEHTPYSPRSRLRLFFRRLIISVTQTRRFRTYFTYL